MLVFLVKQKKKKKFLKTQNSHFFLSLRKPQSFLPELACNSVRSSQTMPTPASPSASASSSHRRASSDLMVRIGSADSEIKLRALRELKNQIIGNRTKKLFFLKLGAVPAVSCALAEAQAQAQADLLVQSAAALGSFACGFDAGVRAVLDSGAFSNLIALLSFPDDKVIPICNN